MKIQHAFAIGSMLDEIASYRKVDPVANLIELLGPDRTIAFDKLIEAYGKIAETLSRLEKLSDAFSDNSAFLGKMALYYADILEFHRRAYKFVRRKCKSESEQRLGEMQPPMQSPWFRC